MRKIKSLPKNLLSDNRVLVATIFTTSRELDNLRDYFLDVNWGVKERDATWNRVCTWAVNKLRSDPYDLRHVKYMGLKRLDKKLVSKTVPNPFHPTRKVLNPFRIPFNSKLRAEGLMHASLEDFYEEGQEVVALRPVVERAMQYLLDNAKKIVKKMPKAQLDKWTKDIKRAMYAGVINGRKVFENVTDDFPDYDGDDDLIVDEDKFQLDCDLVDRLYRMHLLPVEPINDRVFEQSLSKFSKAHSAHISEGQKAGLRSCLSGWPALLLGSAGTGKTTSLAVLVHYLKAMHQVVKLCAISGRAVDNLRQATGCESAEAGTIASLLLQDFYADYLIVDEISMVGQDTLDRLLKRCENQDVKLIMVGDGSQLPAIQTVGMLTGLCVPNQYQDEMSSFLHRYELRHVFRQHESQLKDLVTHIRDDCLPDEIVKKGDKSVKVVPVSEGQKDADQVPIRVAKKMWKKFPDESNLIVTANRSEVWRLNIGVQKALHPGSKFKKLAPHRPFTYLPGDQVIVKRNHRKVVTKLGGEFSIFNGFFGKVVDVKTQSEHPSHTAVVMVKFTTSDGRYVQIPFVLDENRYKRWYYRRHHSKATIQVASIDDDLALGYAVTVHKAQGSTINNVIYWISNSNSEKPLKYQQSLYTALTRASDRLILIVKGRTVEESLMDYLDNDVYSRSSSYLPVAIHDKLVESEVDDEDNGLVDDEDDDLSDSYVDTDDDFNEVISGQDDDDDKDLPTASDLDNLF